jgi:hypothetical protein
MRLRRGSSRSCETSSRSLGRVWEIHDEAIDGHQSHSRIKRMWRLDGPLQRNDLVGQSPQRCRSHAFAGFAERRSTWRSFAPIAMQSPKNLSIAVSAKERQANHKPHDKPTWQPAAMQRAFPRPKSICNRRLAHNSLQCTHALGGRPPHRNVHLPIQHAHRSLLATWDLAHPHRGKRLRFLKYRLNGIGINPSARHCP